MTAYDLAIYKNLPLENVMLKRLFLVLPLTCAALLLSGCPDAKLPKPTPTVPTPKAQHTAVNAPPAAVVKHGLSAKLSVEAGHS